MLRLLLLLPIRLYWRLVPPRRRRQCLFGTTCSQHVYGMTVRDGLWAGLAALTVRFRQCRPGYSYLLDREGMRVRLADGTVVALSVLSWGPSAEPKGTALLAASSEDPAARHGVAGAVRDCR